MFSLHYLTNAVLIENVITTGGVIAQPQHNEQNTFPRVVYVVSPVSISKAGVILHLMWTARATRRLFSLTAHSPDLSEPVDVYSDWIDACEAANQ